VHVHFAAQGAFLLEGRQGHAGRARVAALGCSMACSCCCDGIATLALRGGAFSLGVVQHGAMCMERRLRTWRLVLCCLIACVCARWQMSDVEKTGSVMMAALEPNNRACGRKVDFELGGSTLKLVDSGSKWETKQEDEWGTFSELFFQPWLLRWWLLRWLLLRCVASCTLTAALLFRVHQRLISEFRIFVKRNTIVAIGVRPDTPVDALTFKLSRSRRSYSSAGAVRAACLCHSCFFSTRLRARAAYALLEGQLYSL